MCVTKFLPVFSWLKSAFFVVYIWLGVNITLVLFLNSYSEYIAHENLSG